MQTLVIGDIHGCFDELQALLDHAALTSGDAIVSIGDCVDRGPDTPAVLKFFQEQPQAQLIMGNHERKHVRASRHEVKLARSQQISKIQFGGTYTEALFFMNSLPLYLDLPEALVVHGYFEPGLPVEQQHPSVLCGTMGGERHLRTQYERPWYELYDEAKPILVGHENYSHNDQPFIHRDRVFGLDTDCVTGKALTGLLLPAFRFVSVPSRANHWLQVRRMYPKPEKVFQPRPVLSVWNAEEELLLAQLIAKITHRSQTILNELQSEAGFTELTPRQQTRRFGERAGQGILGTLLQLARLAKLNRELAHRLIKNPELLKTLSQALEE